MHSLKSLLVLAAGSVASIAASAAYVSVEPPVDGIELSCPGMKYGVVYLRPAPSDVLARYSAAYREATGRAVDFGGPVSTKETRRVVTAIQKLSCNGHGRAMVMEKSGPEKPLYSSASSEGQYAVRPDVDAKSLNVNGLQWVYAHESGKPEMVYGPFLLSPEFERNGKTLLLKLEDK
jgi:hypothetical protein